MVGGDLQRQALERDTVVAADGAVVLFAQDVFELLVSCGDEGVALLGGGHHELEIESRAIDFVEVAVGLGHGGDAGGRQFLDQPVLVSEVLRLTLFDPKMGVIVPN